MGRLELSQEFERPPEVVFRFVATEHVRNHPRWDPQMHLEQMTPGALGVGSKLRRRRTRGDVTIEGEMEFIQWEPDRAVTAVIRDEAMTLRSGYRLEPSGSGGTVMHLFVEGDESLPVDAMREAVQGSLRRMKELIEAET